jgi:hypothetical protein
MRFLVSLWMIILFCGHVFAQESDGDVTAVTGVPIVGVSNAIKRDHQEYLALGGRGFLLGDGRLTTRVRTFSKATHSPQLAWPLYRLGCSAHRPSRLQPGSRSRSDVHCPHACRFLAVTTEGTLHDWH